METYRIGQGFDVHQLVENRKLILGGVNIPYEKGLLGHSDADVLLHAICDAMLGALALGDIGMHFPNTDKRIKDISSLTMLEKSNKLIADKKFRVVNIDSTLVLEKPKIAPFIEQMQQNIMDILKLNKSDISIKATTSEKMGYLGRGEGAIAYANVLLVSFE